jgi:hypothetical protein
MADKDDAEGGAQRAPGVLSAHAAGEVATTPEDGGEQPQKDVALDWNVHFRAA